MQTRLRTAARLTPKPLTPFERESEGYEAGRRAAFDSKPFRPHAFRNEDFAEGWRRGYMRVAGDGGLGR